ncbi:hypothetical protein EDC04DRAFT_2901867 [Pisolithus marmoratus]|nr:hypothetical protein EDC04DRAFT_2901867 [Pisolithus marmoratus]
MSMVSKQHKSSQARTNKRRPYCIASEQLLDSILEFEDKPPEFFSKKVEHMANIFKAISAGISRDNVGLESEYYGSGAEEEIDIDAAIQVT